MDGSDFRSSMWEDCRWYLSWVFAYHVRLRSKPKCWQRCFTMWSVHSLAVKTGLSMWFWCLVSNMLILWQNEVAQPPTYISWLSGSRFSCTLLEMSFVIFSERYLVVPQRRGFLDQKRKIHYYSKWNKNKQDKLAD